MALGEAVEPGETAVVNLGTSRAYSVAEVVEKLRRVSGIDFEIRQDEGRVRKVDRPCCAPTTGGSGNSSAGSRSRHSMTCWRRCGRTRISPAGCWNGTRARWSRDPRPGRGGGAAASVGERRRPCRRAAERGPGASLRHLRRQHDERHGGRHRLLHARRGAAGGGAELAAKGIPWSRLADRYSTLFYRSDLSEIVARGNYDLVHLHNPLPALEMARVAQACIARRIPYVVSTHGINEVANGSRIYGFDRLRRLAWENLVVRPVSRVVRQANAVFALSPADVPIVRDMGFRGDPDIVCNGVPCPPRPRRVRMRRRCAALAFRWSVGRARSPACSWRTTRPTRACRSCWRRSRACSALAC
ncbi:glycosyltransferase [Pseudoroseomonas wenyumeiae]